MHLLPRSVEFFRYDGSEAGVDTLSHLRVLAQYSDATVGANVNERLGIPFQVDLSGGFFNGHNACT